MDDARGNDAHLRPDVVEVEGLPLEWTPGCRGHPRPPVGWGLLTRAARALPGDVLDASGLLALPGRAAADGARSVRVLEPSAAGLAAARRAPRGSVVLAGGLPWDAAPAAYDHVLLAPPAERGSARVRAELEAAARALRPGGALLLLLEKDRGAKRYEKEAARIVGPLEVAARSKGWRLARAVRGEGPREEASPWTRFETPRGPAEALAGVFAAGKLDPGTALLLETLEAASVDVAGTGVLDLGCGWGPIARWAARRGAEVTAVDDDLAAVRSTARNAPEAEARHADLDTGLAEDLRFDRVLVNPPFHLGAGVRLALSAAFAAAAARRVRRGGEVWLVANAALDYGPPLEAAGIDARVERAERGFRVWRGSPRRRR